MFAYSEEDFDNYEPISFQKKSIYEKPFILEIGFGGNFYAYEYRSFNDANQAARAFRAYPETYKVQIIDLDLMA